jgi:hypothetical protein
VNWRTGKKTFRRIDRRGDVFFFERVARRCEINGTARFSSRDLECAPEHKRKARRLACFPRDFGELTIHLFLVEPWSRAQSNFVAPDLIVVEPGCNDDGGPVSAGIVELPSHLRCSRASPGMPSFRRFGAGY